MTLALYNVVVKLLLVTALVVPGTQNLLQGQRLAEVKASYTQTVETRQELVAQLRQRETEYRVLLRQIDVLKNGPNTLQNRMELEGLLGDSRKLAGQMQALQQQIRTAEARLENHRGQLVAAIDAKMRAIEKRLAKTSAAERGQLVSTLNELRAERQRFTEPLPSAPTDGELDKTLAMIDELDGASAEDLMAAADELQDTEDQVRKRLDAIKSRIEKLRDAKMLARRARSFAAEDRFFDETDRSRFVAGYSSGSNDEQASGGGAADKGPSTGNNGDTADPGVGAGDDLESGGDESPEPTPDSDYASGRDDSDSLTDQPEGAPSVPAEPEQESPGGDSGSEDGDVFGAADGMLLDSQTDPQASTGAGFDSGRELDSRIQKLESERKRLEEQASQLERKADQLRNRARDSLD